MLIFYSIYYFLIKNQVNYQLEINLEFNNISG